MTVHKKPSPFASQLIRLVGESIALFGKERRVCIIAYHRILEHADPLLPSEPDVETFTWQMETLAACFNVLSLHEAIAAIRENRVPPRAVCISFDDGYRSTHDLALPILTRLGLPATVFVTTGYLDKGMMWNDRIVEAVRRFPEGELDLQAFGMGVQALSGVEDRRKIVDTIDDYCKYLSPEGRLSFLDELEKLVGHVPAFRLMLTREMVASLASHGVEIGGHTVTHPILTRLDDEAARYEIVENKRVLEEITGKSLRLFAYPNGKVKMDFDQRHVKMVEAAGYSAAFTTAFGAATINSAPFELPRARPWDASPLRFAMRLLSWLANHGTEDRRFDSYSDKQSEGDRRTKRNVLLIAFHFPPQAESSGIQRTLSFSKNLCEENWVPSVMSAHPMAYERKNSSQLSQIPGYVQVKRAWVLDSKRHLGLFGRYPEVLALPDRWVSWWFAAVPLALSMMRKSGMPVIWTTYPIATAHLIGLTLQYLTGRVWVADFRDPMLQDDYPVSKWQRKIFGWIERRTIQRCHAAVFTTHGARDIYQQRYPLIAKEKIHVIENGYDEDSFKEVEGGDDKPPLSQTDKITLLHSGVLYSEGRDPSTFFAAIAALKQRGVVAATNLRVVLRASGDDEHVEMLVRQHQIDDVVFVEPHVLYQKALSEMLLVDGLLVFQGATFNTQIPAKIYEYFRARKPIFGMLDLAGETARVLRKAGFHNVADLTSVNDIASELAEFLVQIRTGKAHVATEELIAASSRKHRAQQLAGIFNQITGQRGT